MCELHRAICFIVPPHIHESVTRNGNEKQKERAYQALNVSAHMRGQREILNTFAVLATTPTGTKRRTIYNAQNGLTLPGKLVRGEGDPKSNDTSINEAYDGQARPMIFTTRYLAATRSTIAACASILQSTTGGISTMRSGTASRWYTVTAMAKSFSASQRLST